MGQCRTAVPIYGSGGFTTLSDAQLEEQVAWWQSVGCTAMKIKIGEAWGTRIDRDLARVEHLTTIASPTAELMVDANGAYSIGQARRVGAELDELGVTWFEEPVSSDDTAGLANLRGSLRCDIAAGEYAADLYDVRALLPVVDCLQLDATRCGGYTGWLRGAAARPSPQPASLRPLRPLAARPRRRRRTQPPPRRMVRRSRPPRTATRRQHPHRPRRRPPPQHR